MPRGGHVVGHRGRASVFRPWTWRSRGRRREIAVALAATAVAVAVWWVATWTLRMVMIFG